VRPALNAPLPVARRLSGVMRHLNSVSQGVSIRAASFGGVGGELIAPEGAAGPPRVLYAHGGAYVLASPATHRNITAAIALRTGQPVFALDYRLAPEHPAPAARDDALAAYRAIAANVPGVAIAGDSAGGGIAVACAQAAVAEGLPAPVALGLISPWLDLTLSGESYRENDGRDALLGFASLERGSRAYARVLAPSHPVCSPLLGDLTGLPPMLVQTASKDMLRSDAERLAELAGAVGVEVQLEVAEDLWHDYHVHAGMLREADDSLERLGVFLADRLA
jgi:epsilon-lactone hydrolase